MVFVISDGVVRMTQKLQNQIGPVCAEGKCSH